METIADLIEAARRRTGATYTEISDRLDRSKQLITNWKSGKKVPTDGDILALARMAGENADKWLAIAAGARSEGEARTRWERIAQRLATNTAALLLVVGLALPPSAQAAGMHEMADALYIMRSRVTRRLRWVLWWLQSHLPSRPPSDTEIQA